MGTPTPDNAPRQRRSERIAKGVFVRVRGMDKDGKAFTEDRWTLNVSFQGCKYLSRYSLAMHSWVTLEIFNEKEKTFSQPYRSRVMWLQRSQQLKGLFQVGVELETADNIWGIANPPESWRKPDAEKKPIPAAAATPAAASAAPQTAIFEHEMKALLVLVDKGNYYQLLQITPETPRAQIRHNYYELVRKYHPDRHMAHAERMQPLNKLMEAITSAYRILTDELERQKYDEWLATSGARGMGRTASAAVPETADQCVQKARDCFKARNPGGAIVWMRKAVVIEPTSAKYHALLARALSTMAPLRKEAVEHFEQSLEIDPWNSLVRMQLGAVYEEMKLPWRARPHYDKVLELEPDNAKALERVQALDEELVAQGGGKRSFFDRILRPK